MSENQGREVYKSRTVRSEEDIKEMKTYAQGSQEELLRDAMACEVKDENLDRMVKDAKDFVLGIYARVGQKIAEEDLPRVVLVGEKFDREHPHWLAGFSGKFLTVQDMVLISLDEDELKNAYMMGHELFHAAGRSGFGMNEIDEDESRKAVFATVGAVVMGRNRENKRQRGLVIEESLATWAGITFAVEQGHRDGSAAELYLLEEMGEEYNAAVALLKELTGGTKEESFDLLLKARRDNKLKAKVSKIWEEKYGDRDLVRQVWSVPFEYEAITELREKLKTRRQELEDQRP